MTAYKKRVKERDDALSEVYELKKLIRDFVVNNSRKEEIKCIVLEFQLEEDLEAILWAGTIATGNNFNGILKTT